MFFEHPLLCSLCSANVSSAFIFLSFFLIRSESFLWPIAFTFRYAFKYSLLSCSYECITIHTKYGEAILHIHSLLEIFIQYCSRLNCGPLKYAHLEPQNVTLYEIRVFIDVIKVPLDGFTLEKILLCDTVWWASDSFYLPFLNSFVGFILVYRA